MPESPVALKLIEDDLRTAESRVADLRSLLEVARRVYGTPAPEHLSAPDGATPAPAAAAAGTDGALPLAGMATKPAAIEALKMQSEPVSLPALAEFMVANGWETTASVPADTLKSALKGIDPEVFYRVSRGRYVYKEPVPAAPPAAPTGGGSIDFDAIFGGTKETG